MKKNIFPLEADHYYHIYNRGINGGKIFFSHENYLYFIKLCKEKIKPVADFYCYCLFPNHFHFLVKIKSEKEIRENFPDKKELEISKIISQQFANTFNSYTQGINKHFSRSGKLFELPFRRKEILKEDYLTNAILYIHSNPKKHLITDDIINYSYSSMLIIFSENESFVKSKYVLNLFDGKDNFITSHNNYKPN